MPTREEESRKEGTVDDLPKLNGVVARSRVHPWWVALLRQGQDGHITRTGGDDGTILGRSLDEEPDRKEQKQECECYHTSEPLAGPKVSHWPPKSALLERNFERAEVRKGVSRGTSRRNSYLGLNPGQKPTCSSHPFWTLT